MAETRQLPRRIKSEAAQETQLDRAASLVVIEPLPDRMKDLSRLPSVAVARCRVLPRVDPDDAKIRTPTARWPNLGAI
jgi:hypothetical protein